ncbi:helix-turn-helix transcriptional regulator [Galbibacter sp. PAP.153]|uniref:helix-turn-helix transcriptional regulator n=1 Tax=Galbibacter sp. PAP.153 TaxID=3104623 RepID=UPI003009E296
MEKYNVEELELLAIQIGCIIRLSRLENKLSQEELALLVGTNSTRIGRIERAEHISGWDKLLLICQQLKIDFTGLFSLKTKRELLIIIEDSFNLEERLNQDKKDYYSFLKKIVSKKYS